MRLVPETLAQVLGIAAESGGREMQALALAIAQAWADPETPQPVAETAQA